jgi:hypothetical protein
VQFLDIADSAIVNVALPSIQYSLGFSRRTCRVASGYILTYGGFLPLGAASATCSASPHAAHRPAVFALSSLTAGLADSAGVRISQVQLVMGLRQPAGLRQQAPGRRALLARDRGGERQNGLDRRGGVVTSGMLLLVYSLVRAPMAGWGSLQTILTLMGSAVLLIAFAANELRSRYPLVPFAILRVKGLVAADLTQLIAFTGFFSMFFYATLYMQEILRYSPLQAGVAYLPITAGFAVAGGMASQLVTRIGTRPVVVAGCLIAGAGIYYVSRVPLHGSYVSDLLPGFLVMSLGAGSVFVSVTAAANAGVPSDKAGLAAGLLNSSQQIGSALGLAILSAVAITRTNHLMAAHVPHFVAADAATTGFCSSAAS